MEPLEASVDSEAGGSVLIVSCPICPPISLAIRSSSPLIELFEGGLSTGAFEQYVDEVRKTLEQRGVRTDLYSIYTPCPAMCLWTDGRRRLRKRAEAHDLVVVLGCASATRTAAEAPEDTDCRVLQAMQVNGLTNAKLRYRFPMTLDLEEAVRVVEEEEDGQTSP